MWSPSLRVVTPAVFTDDPAAGTGTQRDYTAFATTIYYSPSTDFSAPLIELTDAFIAGGIVEFSVTADAGTGDTVQRVLVLFKDDTGLWTPVNLIGVGNGEWAGSASGVVGDRVEFFVHVVDENGNVAVSTNKARFYTARLVQVEASPQSVDEGQQVSLSTWFTVPSAIPVSTVQLAVDWGDGAEQVITDPVSGASVVHDYTRDGTYTIETRIGDGAGFEVCDTTRVVVVNVVPIVDAGADYAGIDPMVTIEGTFTDPGVADVHSVVIDWGDGTSSTQSIGAGDRAFADAHTYAAEGTYLVTATVSDELDSGVDSVTVDVTSADDPVVLQMLTMEPIGPVELISGLGADADATLTWTGDADTVVFDWGDDTSTTLAPIEDTTSLSKSHTYLDAGVFSVVATVTDSFGTITSIAYDFVVVFDPSSGFITGNDEFPSPSGAWTGELGPADPDDVDSDGRAVEVGFHVKYKDGYPKGKVKVDFEEVDQEFESSSLDYLVIAGDWAQVSGLGTFEDDRDSTEYQFVITVVDGKVNDTGPDLIRIQVRSATDPSIVIYDSQLGDTDNANPTTNAADNGLKIKSKNPQ